MFSEVAASAVNEDKTRVQATYQVLDLQFRGSEVTTMMYVDGVKWSKQATNFEFLIFTI